MMTNHTAHITQTPRPGERRLHFRGDWIVFQLTVDPAVDGSAFLRTNLGHADIIRKEIINLVERNEPRLAREWFDIPMTEFAPGRYQAAIGLDEVGHFEAKCLFIPQDRDEPLWPEGANTTVNVEPAHTCCGNIIYNAFVRQFGPNKKETEGWTPPAPQAIENLDRAGYTVIPPSGTFRDLIDELDFIMGRLGCRYVQLLPIHPTPTTYGRMGRFGSPYAALSFTEVDPALAVFDPKATPLEQFIELVDAVHARSGYILIDIAINHTGWAARLHATHPQWLARKECGEIQNPGAWGVVWEDLTHLDYHHKELWHYMADVLLTWCTRGVDGFRCDAGYMIPAAAWQYMIAKVRDQFPDTLFFLEGLGGKISVTRDLLNQANFNWAYSELFQNYNRSQIERYLPGAIDISSSDGITVHFAETHDNNRLAQTSETYARMRTALCALLSPFGAFAFANGVEWLATQKINVHDDCSLNWGADRNQVEPIARISQLMKVHPAFGPGVKLSIISRGKGNFIALGRHHVPTDRRVVIVANLDWKNSVTAGWDPDTQLWEDSGTVDLLTDRPVDIQAAPDRHMISLEPGQVLCLADAGDMAAIPDDSGQMIPAAVDRQRFRAKAMEVLTHYDALVPQNIDQAVDGLWSDPGEFCRSCNPHSEESRVVLWEYPHDLKRRVMVPPGHFVLIRAPHPFKVSVVENEKIMALETSLTDKQGRPFALVKPQTAEDRHCLRQMDISLFGPDAASHLTGRLLYLCGGKGRMNVQTTFTRQQCYDKPLLAMGTNGRGAMMRVHSDWSRLDSRYDALLAANLNPDYPEDRHNLFARCRGWVVYQGHSQQIRLDCLERFAFDYDNGAQWDYQIPTGQGEHIRLMIRAQMPTELANTIQLEFHRPASRPDQLELEDARPIQLILRPDIEDRNFHHTTKAFTGPEHQWPEAIHTFGSGFTFTPTSDHGLAIQMERSRFTAEPEWDYMVHRPTEAQRGLEADSDLFSPGYFSCRLQGGQGTNLTAQAVPGEPRTLPELGPSAAPSHRSATRKTLPLEEALKSALDRFVVRRGDFRTVIAGYPWFLDWGRDTLIVARGLVAAGRHDVVKAILMQFAGFEDCGTLPNMIRGDDAGNRDTSDAPLWLFTVSADLAAATGGTDFLESDCNGRSLKQILKDLAAAIISGTPNGVAMDTDSGLIFSPSHFTWMDTNYPAGTPRQGYPIEIQALWFAALRFLSAVDAARKKPWADLAEQVRAGIHKFFWRPELGYLSDCRHCGTGQRAQEAAADDALRPNQLLAITLGAVTDPSICRQILDHCQSLLVPGAIRSLADRPVQTPIAVRHNGILLNNPNAPYWGTYGGDEDTRRKPAYHNGTAWTWPFPSFCEAWATTYGPGSIATARAWLSSASALIDSHCVGQIPEIVDGDAPHAQRGCDAQAWGVSEVLRVWIKLKG